jgi:hypothetical protein
MNGNCEADGLSLQRDPATEEHVVDFDGEETIPTNGAIIERKGKQWKVVAVHKEETVTTPKATPVYRMYLSDLL